jgi:hypothetical protein
VIDQSKQINNATTLRKGKKPYWAPRLRAAASILPEAVIGQDAQFNELKEQGW